MQFVSSTLFLPIPENIRDRLLIKLRIENIKRIKVVSLFGFLFLFIFMGLDYWRYTEGRLVPGTLYYYLFLNHLCFVFFLLPLILINLNMKSIALGRWEYSGRFIYGWTITVGIIMIPMAILSLIDRGSIMMYTLFIILANFCVILLHKDRMVLNLLSLLIIVITAFLLFSHSIETLSLIILESTGITVACFIVSNQLFNAFIKETYHEQELEEKSFFLEQQKKRIEVLAQTKTNLYTNITHEFRTPLTVIQGMVEELPGKYEARDLILRNTKNLLHMINQILDLSKLESNTMKANYVQYDIVSFLSYLIESWSSYANTKLISLNFYSNIPQLLMDFDAKKLEQIITNLLSNALKFTPKYGKVQVAAERENDWLVLIIKDTGIGIPESKLPHIFDRFYQIDPDGYQDTTRPETPARSDGSRGTGIGLALVKELIQLLKGKIEVESKVQKGTTFKVYLPITKGAFKGKVELSESKELPSGKLPSTLTSQSTSNPLLLIIEDNQDVITYLKTCLNHQYEIITANNGRKGVALAQEELPEIILCDVMMPEMDGFEVCRMLKEEDATSHIPIILLTAKATQEAKIEGLTAGADAYLTKPFDKSELLIRLQNLIEIRKRLHLRFAKGLPLDAAEKSGISVKDQSFLDKLTQFIKDRLSAEDLQVIHLQRAVNMSRGTLYKKLKALTGMNTSQFRKAIRLQEAKKLLQNEHDLTVSEVAYRVGYKHPSHFSRDFKEMFGIVPGDLKV